MRHRRLDRLEIAHKPDTAKLRPRMCPERSSRRRKGSPTRRYSADKSARRRCRPSEILSAPSHCLMPSWTGTYTECAWPWHMVSPARREHF